MFWDGFEKKIKKNAILCVKNAFIHLWGSRGYEYFIKPPLYKLSVQDLALTSEDKNILELIKQGKNEQEIVSTLKMRGMKEEEIKAILTKLGDRDKIREMLEEKYDRADEEDLDKWQNEFWACKTSKGWLFLKYRCPKGHSLLDRFSLIKYRYLDTGLLIKLNLAINIVLLILLVIMALGYQYPILIYYMQSIITTRDLFWVAVVTGLLYILVNLKLNERVFYANFVYIREECVDLPIRIGDDAIVCKIHTVYLYQSDSIPPAFTDIFLINTEMIERVLKKSIIREHFNTLKENMKLILQINHLRDEINNLRAMLDDYKRTINEAYLLGLSAGLKQRKAHEAIFKTGSGSIPWGEVIKAILILGVIGIAGYVIMSIAKSTLGLYVLMAVFGFICVIVIILLIKTIVMRAEYKIVQEVS